MYINKVAKAVRVVGWLVVVGGVILGFANWTPYGIFDESSIFILITYATSGAVTGVMVFGFAEIITILDDSREYQREQLNKLRDINHKLSNKEG